MCFDKVESDLLVEAVYGDISYEGDGSTERQILSSSQAVIIQHFQAQVRELVEAIIAASLQLTDNEKAKLTSDIEQYGYTSDTGRLELALAEGGLDEGEMLAMEAALSGVSTLDEIEAIERIQTDKIELASAVAVYVVEAIVEGAYLPSGLKGIILEELYAVYFDSDIEEIIDELIDDEEDLSAVDQLILMSVIDGYRVTMAEVPLIDAMALQFGIDESIIITSPGDKRAADSELEQEQRTEKRTLSKITSGEKH